MNTEAADRRQRDRLTDWRFNLLAYCIPIAAIVATGTPAVGTGWRTAAWAASSAVMGRRRMGADSMAMPASGAIQSDHAR